MIIFMDDLARYDSTAAELQEDGAAGPVAEPWREVEKAPLARIENTLEVLAAGTHGA